MPHTHLLAWLAFGTLFLVVMLGLWSYASVKRNQATGGNTSGIGGPNDPMA